MNHPLTTGMPFTINDKSTFGEVLDDILSLIDSEVFLVGTSLGGNVVVDMLTEYKYQQRVKGGVAVCPALDLPVIVDHLKTYRGGFYDKVFGMGLKFFYA
jgi:predicted alpha/beta-fold hydrolase